MNQRPMRMLVSVRSVDEALAAAAGGADFIDLKEPDAGALGGLPIATVREVVGALRDAGIALPISATIGDLPMDDVAQILDRVDAVGACGVDYVKVGIERGPGAAAVIDALSRGAHPVVPVFIADRGLDDMRVAQACAANGVFPAVMVDTADKRSGSLFDVLTPAALQRFVDTVRAAGAMVGVAGALRADHIPRIAALQPDFAGFRSAVCIAARGSQLDVAKLRRLAALINTTRPIASLTMGG